MYFSQFVYLLRPKRSPCLSASMYGFHSFLSSDVFFYCSPFLLLFTSLSFHFILFSPNKHHWCYHSTVAAATAAKKLNVFDNRKFFESCVLRCGRCFLRIYKVDEFESGDEPLDERHKRFLLDSCFLFLFGIKSVFTNSGDCARINNFETNLWNLVEEDSCYFHIHFIFFFFCLSSFKNFFFLLNSFSKLEICQWCLLWAENFPYIPDFALFINLNMF